MVSLGKSSEMGIRLRAIRKAANLTLTNVSNLSGVSVSMLSKIENDLVSPSFDIIKKICDSLEMSIEEFVRPGSTIQVSGRKTVTTLRDGVVFTSGQYDYRVHATELSRKGMVPLEIVVRARTIAEFDHWSRHRGEEFVYVVSGAIEVHTEFYEPFRLNATESCYFDSSMAHLYVTVSEEDALVLSISYDPEQGRGKLTDLLDPSAEPVQEDDERLNRIA